MPDCPDLNHSMETFDHFAYGSNMSTARLRARCPSAQAIVIGYVRGRQLRFHKRGLDGTGKADAFWTGNSEHVLWGVIYRCRLDEKHELDRCESLGEGYEQVPVEVHVADSIWPTFLYQAMPQRIDSSLVPATWYFNHVYDGAREHGLPQEYQQLIARFDHRDFSDAPVASVLS